MRICGLGFPAGPNATFSAPFHFWSTRSGAPAELFLGWDFSFVARTGAKMGWAVIPPIDHGVQI
ncbi:hypothetical protein TRIATDRAFT_300723 [Trichoderma atroviride IMI 206040]|uniref:Uncharacterized protein n=1 Tax=Hypocrea atroviridis (strain ATCC 20476 / IMI 206040) TaxID=452589 RepID=G9P178_HYPAI|nr:uncharacterized protein TRIATDRAFT_300723 [Trichoderma atroviride IMI 206040]EHK42486.1 hypothetical protein TRIATDRAFT_300723 [Trichoderma atroviride IMI 206040]